MGAFAVIQFEPIVEAAFQPCDDGVRRWRDLDVAEWLGLAQPRSIRTVIEDNRDELERHGPLLVVPTTPVTGGPIASENRLTFEQAMVICTLSRTPRAEDVRTVMIQVFSKVVNGGIATMPRMELRALEIAADRIVAPILLEQREFHSQVLVRMDRHEGRLAVVERGLVDLQRQVVGNRRGFSNETRRRYIGTAARHYNGFCPCCRLNAVTINGEPSPEAEFDHWHSREKRQAHQGWIVCRHCNAQLSWDSEFKTSKYGAFMAFQDALRAYDQQSREQGTLDFT